MAEDLSEDISRRQVSKTEGLEGYSSERTFMPLRPSACVSSGKQNLA